MGVNIVAERDKPDLIKLNLKIWKKEINLNLYTKLFCFHKF